MPRQTQHNTKPMIITIIGESLYHLFVSIYTDAHTVPKLGLVFGTYPLGI